jgi:hypothetical protein
MSSTFKCKCSIAKHTVYGPSWQVGPIFGILFANPLARTKVLFTPSLLLKM